MVHHDSVSSRGGRHDPTTYHHVTSRSLRGAAPRHGRLWRVHRLQRWTTIQSGWYSGGRRQGIGDGRPAEPDVRPVRSTGPRRERRVPDLSELQGRRALPVSYTHLRAHETDSYLVC